MGRSERIVVIGYSGHSFVACEILQMMGAELLGYCEVESKAVNPFDLEYLGNERDPVVVDRLRGSRVFVAIGANKIREKALDEVSLWAGEIVPLSHPTASVSDFAKIAPGSMIGAGAVVNPLAEIGRGAIINSGAIIEHGSKLGDSTHVAPGAVVCGDVIVGKGAFIGAGAVVKQGISIGAGALIGAGAVVVKDVPDKAVQVGNPANSKSG